MTTNILVQGHNRPPDDADPLAERLAEDHVSLLVRKRDLLDAEQRLPLVVDGDSCGKVSDFARQIQGCIKAAETAHRDEKAPFLQACRTVDAWLSGIKTPLSELKTRVERRVGTYLAAKEKAERERREEEARALARQAKEMEIEGDKVGAKEIRAEARDLRAEARNATPADLVRTHTGLGGVATLKTAVEFEIKDKEAAATALWAYFDDESIAKAVRAFIRVGKDQLRAQIEDKKQPIPGVRFFISRAASIR